MKVRHAIFVTLALLGLAGPLSAKVIGTNSTAEPLTAARIAKLPAAQQGPWRDYLTRSEALRAADQKFLADEIQRHGLTESVSPTTGKDSPKITDRRPEAWFATAEARLMADNVITFQTPAGGWSKNFNTADHARRPGEGFSPTTNLSKFLRPGDNDRPADPHWTYIGTFDNRATVSELRFLARVSAAADATTGARWREAFLRGLEYILVAQYPNGGWPQNFPLDGEYHDSICFNDGAMINVMRLLRSVAAGQAEFSWVPAPLRARAAAAEARGLACILDCQVISAGQLTVWAQQHDMLTLQPAPARNYEMPALSPAESADIVEYLMQLPQPDARTVAAVHAAIRWMKAVALRDVKWDEAPDGTGRKLLPAPGAGPLWARYYEIGTHRPIFGDRDKTIHDDVAEISHERREGYGWFGQDPQSRLAQYAKWARSHPAP